jgi:hypothetical protein
MYFETISGTEVRTMPLPLLDLSRVLAIHDASVEYAVRIQGAASEKTEEETTNLVARSAISTLMHDLACLHQGVKTLCAGGWACACPILLRSMLEHAMSMAVIIRSDRPDLTAFQYFYAPLSEELSDPTNKSVVAEREANLARHLPQMAQADQASAKEFLVGPPPRPYWYSGIFRGPTAILKKFFDPRMLGAYEGFSIAAHGGFMGLRQFRDEPDKLDINPRTDPRSQGFSMLVSSRLLIEATHLRESFETFSDGGYETVLKMVVAIGGG